MYLIDLLMMGHVFLPHPALQEFVLQLVTIDIELPEKSDAVITPYPPTPLQSLMFYGEDRIAVRWPSQKNFSVQPDIVVVGPQYTRVNIMVRRRLRAVRVDFHPGGLHRLLHVPMVELFDKGFDATDILGHEMKSVNEQIVNADNIDVAKVIVEKYLLSKVRRLKSPLPMDRSLRNLVSNHASCTIESLASDSCMSLRQFERKCKERIGMSPKAFARIVRFSKAYQLREANDEIPWTTIAHHCNYFDQMHMIRDFKEFAGVTPTILEEELSRTPFRMQANLLF